MNTIKQWLLQKSKWSLALSGLLLGVAAPGVGLWPLAWVGLVPALCQLIYCKNWIEALRQGLFLGCVYYAVLFAWFFGIHPLTWLGVSEWMSFAIMLTGWGVATVTQALILSLVWMGWYGLWRWKPWALLLAGPILWVMGLWFLNQNPIGLPWGFLAYSQAPVDWIRQSVFTYGLWGLESLIVAVNLLLFWGLQKKHTWVLAPTGLGLLGLFLASTLHHPAPNDVLRQLDPVVIQGNIPIEVERLFLTASEKQQYYSELIAEASQHQKSRLIILPEGVLSSSDIPGITRNLSRHTALLSGGSFGSFSHYYNGALLISPSRAIQRLGKRYLVPFGETTPFISEEWLQQQLAPWGIHYSKGFSRGDLHQPPLSLHGIRIGPLICFEALYPNLVSGYKQHGVDLLVTFSNLGWYHQHPFLERQFLAINQMRATETGVPLILATNTGVSAVISATGKVLSQTASGQAQILTPHHAWTPQRPSLEN